MTKAKQETSWFKRHKVLSIVLGVILLFIVIAAVGGGADKDGAKNSSTDASKAAESTAKIGVPARDGKFEFVVKSVECGVASVGSNPYLTKTAQGQYCLLNVSVKNIGDEAQSLLSSDQHLFNASGQKYSADDTATLYNAPDDNSWYNNINPGNVVEGAIVFDMPKDQTPTTAELHDSSFSGGVKVSLQ
jgi:hypothetical protein